MPIQFSRTQSGQKSRFSVTQSLASPKSGMTGPATTAAAPSAGRASAAARPVAGLDDDRAGAVGQHHGERVAERRLAVEQRPDGAVRRLELDLLELGQREPLQAAVGADEAGDEVVGGVGEELLGRVVLGEDPALAQDRDPVAEEDRLVDVVGDEDDRLAQLMLDAQQLVLQPRRA